MTKRTALAMFCLFTSVGLAACQRATPGTTTVLIVRHGEKVSQDVDAPLSDAGRQRAEALAETAAGAAVTVIYSSQFTRNKDTVRPLSERTGVAVTEYPVNLSDPGDYGK